MWPMSCFPAGMRIASGGARIVWTGLLAGAMLVSLVLETRSGHSPVSRRPQVERGFSLIPAQLSMGRPGFTPTPKERKAPPPATPAKPDTALTPLEQKRIAAAMNHLSPKERKRLAKAVKKMTPEQSRQFLAALKRQFAQTTPPKR
jgi:hypothetical protein